MQTTVFPGDSSSHARRESHTQSSIAIRRVVVLTVRRAGAYHGRYSPQLTIATAVVFCHRYFSRHSFANKANDMKVRSDPSPPLAVAHGFAEVSHGPVSTSTTLVPDPSPAAPQFDAVTMMLTEDGYVGAAYRSLRRHACS